MNNPVIEYKGVSKVFGKKLVLNSFNMDVNKGEIFGLIGASGAGKTTVLNMLIGFIKPDKGDIKVQSLQHDSSHSAISIKDKMEEVRMNFGFAAQSPSFYYQLTVFENLLYFASLYGLDEDTKHSNIDTVIELVGLQDSKDEYASNLSGGMKKRLDIACALVHSPNVLVLDEPTADLDPVLRRDLWELIKRINKRGTTILMSSHFLDEIDRICDRVGIIRNGKMEYVGTPTQIKKKFVSTEQIMIETSPGNYGGIIKELSKINNKITKLDNEGHRLVIHTSRSEEVLHKILSVVKSRKESLTNVSIKKPSLDEIFDAVKEDRK